MFTLALFSRSEMQPESVMSLGLSRQLWFYRSAYHQLDVNCPKWECFNADHLLCSTECRITADIAFLLDGSGSVDVADFEKMKEFVINLIRSLQGKYTKVELLHFILKTLILHVKIWIARITLFGQVNFALPSSIKSQPFNGCTRSSLEISSSAHAD